jgi:O-antigen/teichoic acid export membrane protein
MDLKSKAVTGVSWSVFAQVGQEITQWLGTFLLARLLAPADFGLLGMVTVFTGFIGVFRNFGLGPSIIQDRDMSQEELSGVFWFNVGFSVFLFAVMIIGAPMVAGYYQEPDLVAIMIVLALDFPLSALSMVHDALLRKRMRFRKLALVQNLGGMVGWVVGVGMAVLGLGVWALVGVKLARTLATTLVQWVILNWKPGWGLSYKRIRNQLQFGLSLQAGTLLNYATTNVDDMLIGRVGGSEVLGEYQMAYRMMLWPLAKVSAVVSGVMFPALSTIKDDKERVRRVFLKATSYIALLTFPMALGLWAVAPSAVHALLGAEWAGVIPIFQVLCILGVGKSIATNTGWIFLSQGRLDLRLRLQILFSIIMISSFFVGINWGPMGVAVCYTVVTLPLIFVQFHIAGSVVDMSVLDVIQVVKWIFFCSVVMSVGVLGVGYVLPSNWTHFIRLLFQIVAGLLIYLSLVHLLKLEAYREVRELAWGQVGRFLKTIRRSSGVHLGTGD